MWKLTIGEEGTRVIYTAGTKEKLEKILSELKIPETVKVEIKYIEK
jgi:ribosomal protein S10